MVVTTIPAISILMAAYNAEKTIGQAIDSVLAQTFCDYELLVINDGSTDRTREIVLEKQAQDAENAGRAAGDGLMASGSRIRLIDMPVNGGVSAARRRGIEEARGEWIAILDSDDLWEPQKLEKQMRLHEEKGAELIFTASGFISEDGTPIDWILHAPEKLSYRQLLRQNLVSNSSVLVKKELYEANYASGDRMHEDFATWLRITKSGVDAYGIDETLLIYRLSSSSKSGDKKKAALMNWNTYRYIGLSLPEAVWYMLCYTVNGIKKYRTINRHRAD